LVRSWDILVGFPKAFGHTGLFQGCQMVSFQTKNLNLSKFWRALEYKVLLEIMIIWNILQPLCIFYGHFGNFLVIWYIFPRFGALYQEKSGNPGLILAFL
jgi:hypothetical protein